MLITLKSNVPWARIGLATRSSSNFRSTNELPRHLYPITDFQDKNYNNRTRMGLTNQNTNTKAMTTSGKAITSDKMPIITTHMSVIPRKSFI